MLDNELSLYSFHQHRFRRSLHLRRGAGHRWKTCTPAKEPPPGVQINEVPLIDVHGFKVTVHPHEIVTIRMIGITGTSGAHSMRSAEPAKRATLEQ